LWENRHSHFPPVTLEMQATTDRSAAIALDILAKIFREDLGRRLAVRLWDGTQVPACSDRAPAFIVNAPYALRAALTPPLDLNPGRAFVSGLIDVEGDIVDAVDVFMRGLGRISNAAAVPLLGQLLRLPKPPAFADRGEAQLRGVAHSRRRDAQAVGFHYDQSLEFYRNFLDEHLVYSCAYFDDGVETLADAQLAKIDHLFRKLRLAPGERLLDIGCGWGALVLRAAAHWGVQATGITLSRSQYEEGRRRIAQANLEDRATIELCDYRDLGGRTFDKIVSVGMFEHVGRRRFDEYFEAAYRALRPGGLFVNHHITGTAGGRFIDRYVFPDGELVPIDVSVHHALRAGFDVRDVENLREHYARTLTEWVANLERNGAAVTRIAGSRAFRIWRLYMGGSAQGFRSGRLGLFQTLLAKPYADGTAAIPATRRDLYAGSQAALRPS